MYYKKPGVRKELYFSSHFYEIFNEIFIHWFERSTSEVWKKA